MHVIAALKSSCGKGMFSVARACVILSVHKEVPMNDRPHELGFPLGPFQTSSFGDSLELVQTCWLGKRSSWPSIQRPSCLFLVSDPVRDLCHLQGDPRYLHSSMADNLSGPCYHGITYKFCWTKHIRFSNLLGIHPTRHLSLDKSTPHPFHELQTREKWWLTLRKGCRRPLQTPGEHWGECGAVLWYWWPGWREVGELQCPRSQQECHV